LLRRFRPRRSIRTKWTTKSKEHSLYPWVAQTMKIQFGKDTSMTSSMTKSVSVVQEQACRKKSALYPSVAKTIKIKFVSQ
jgi:hypothetical protein